MVERDAYNGGYLDSTSADRLVTILSERKTMGDISDDQAGPVPMEIDAVQGQDQLYFRCHRTGNLKMDCFTEKTMEIGG